MKRYLTLVLACAVVLPVLVAEEPSAVFRPISFGSALQAAAQEKKIVLIDFFTTWCGPCKMLDRTTWKDPAVGSLLRQKAVPIRLDAEKEVALARRYTIDAYPTILLLRADGSVIDRFVGYRPAAAFAQEFTSSLAGKTSLVRAQEEVADAASGSDEQVQARLRLASVLAAGGKYPEALKEYLWLYDVGLKSAPKLAWTRNTVALTGIAALSRHYPPAAQALMVRRDRIAKELMYDSEESPVAVDLAALNHALKRDDDTLRLYDQFALGDARRSALGACLFSLFLRKHRYQDAVAAQPAEQFLALFDRQAAMVAHFAGNPTMAEALKQGAAYNALAEIQALAGAGQMANARKVGDRLRAFDSSKVTADAISEELQSPGAAPAKI